MFLNGKCGTRCLALGDGEISQVEAHTNFDSFFTLVSRK